MLCLCAIAGASAFVSAGNVCDVNGFNFMANLTLVGSSPPGLAWGTLTACVTTNRQFPVMVLFSQYTWAPDALPLGLGNRMRPSASTLSWQCLKDYIQSCDCTWYEQQDQLGVVYLYMGCASSSPEQTVWLTTKYRESPTKYF